VASGNAIDAVARGPSGFVAITHGPNLDPSPGPQRNNLAAVSVDGVNWTEQSIVPDGHYNDIAFGRGVYVAVGGITTGVVIASRDGRSWNQVAEMPVGDLGAPRVLWRVRHTPAGFIAVGLGGKALISPDGLSWEQAEIMENPGARLNDAVFADGRFLVAGNFLATSTDARTWVRIGCGPQLPCLWSDPSGNAEGFLMLGPLLFGNDIFLLNGERDLFHSTDGLSWSRAGEPRTGWIVFAGGLFIELAGSNDRPARSTLDVSTSRDGSVWRKRTTASVGRSDMTCLTNRCLLLPWAIVMIP
jgi:hypothetical protein